MSYLSGINGLCTTCTQKCKQFAQVKVVVCTNFKILKSLKLLGSAKTPHEKEAVLRLNAF